MVTQFIPQFASTLPLSLLTIFVFVVVSPYCPALLAAVPAKRHRPPVGGWSTCSTCGNNEICDACHICHYCNDIALPCGGVLRRKINRILIAINHRQDAAAQRATIYGPENDDEPGESPLKFCYHHNVTSPRNVMNTSSQATMAHHFTLQPQAQRTPLEALIHVEIAQSCSAENEDLNRLHRAACIYEMQPQGGLFYEELDPAEYNSDLFESDITDVQQPQPGSGDGKVARSAEQCGQCPRPLPLVDGGDWLIIRQRPPHSGDDEGDQSRPASLPTFPLAPTTGAAAIVLVVVCQQQQQGGHS
jgi:hypothetical protein